MTDDLIPPEPPVIVTAILPAEAPRPLDVLGDEPTLPPPPQNVSNSPPIEEEGNEHA